MRQKATGVNIMKVCEVFESVQGEGKYAGTPALFIRLSGCNKKCSFCDTKYHTKGIQMTVKELSEKIVCSNTRLVVWTGGEPMLQYKEIMKVMKAAKGIHHYHMETNGTILNEKMFEVLDYIGFSPKNEEDAKKLSKFLNYKNYEHDVKVVTDLKMNKNLIKYATMLMPLTTHNKNTNKKNMKAVWGYCTENNIKYSPRLHVDVWGAYKRMI